MNATCSVLLACAGLLALPATAQPAAPALACQVAQPAVPAIGWHGQARYRAKSVARDGRVVQIEIVPLTAGVERRAQRALVMAIQQALRDATCQPGEHTFEQDFSFDIPPPPAALASPG